MKAEQPMRNRILETGLLLSCASAAFLLATYSEEMLRSFVADSDPRPQLPFVGQVPWLPGDEYTHFFSTPASLVPAFAVSMATAGLVEVAKSRLKSRRTLAAYLALLAFQILVAWSAFANRAWDWAIHFESSILTGGSQQPAFTFRSWSPDWPWFSLAPFGAVLAVALAQKYWGWLKADSGLGENAADGRRRLKLWITILAGVFLGAVLTPWIVDVVQHFRPWPSLVTLAFAVFALMAAAVGFLKRKISGSEAAWKAKVGMYVPSLLCCAWLLGALTPWLTNVWFPPDPKWAHLGNVAAIPWSDQTEPRSTTVVLLGALAIGLVAVGLVELAKILRIHTFQGSGYGWLLGFQMVLFLDVLNSAAPDWSSYFLTRIFPASLQVAPDALPNWPWLSLLALTGILAWGRRRDARC